MCRESSVPRGRVPVDGVLGVETGGLLQVSRLVTTSSEESPRLLVGLTSPFKLEEYPSSLRVSPFGERAPPGFSLSGKETVRGEGSVPTASEWSFLERCTRRPRRRASYPIHTAG